MNKIIKVQIADIVLDYRQASDFVNEACWRGGKYCHVVGLCEYNDSLILSLEEIPDKIEHVFSEIPSKSEEDLIAEIRSRYFSGFSLIGDFDCNGKKWGLFSKKAK